VQFTKGFKQKIRNGEVTLSFRTWRRPQAKIGGIYKLHPTGAIRVKSVEQVPAASITRADSIAAGFADAARVSGFLGVDGGTKIYRIAFEAIGDDQVPARPVLDTDQVIEKLERTDARSDRPWTAEVLRAIDEHPKVRAADLAPQFGWETAKFKANVRKLKGLGLTTSREVGYELTALGRRVSEQREMA